MAERFAYYGITSNLITYLTGPLRESTAAGATNENLWSGAASSLALVGAFLADSWLGRYRTVLYSSVLAFLGLGMLTLSATLPALKPPECATVNTDVSCPQPSTFQVAFFFFSLYFVALAHEGHKPCTQAFGADQFDTRDPAESASRSSFFNYWYFGVCTGTISAQLILNYIQDNYGWEQGFGIPFGAVGISLVAFFVGRKTYRYHPVAAESPFVRIAQVCGASSKNRWQLFSRVDDPREKLLPDKSDHFECTENTESREPSSQSNSKMSEDEVKSLARLFPLWSTCVVYAMVFAQPPTLFTKQGSTMERHIGSSFQIPAAALQSCITLTTIGFLPIYDSFIVPSFRKLTGGPSGLSMLQLIGTGMFLSVLSTVLAALVEMRRLRVARESGLVDRPDITVPMSIWWLTPQNILFGISDAFTTVGLQEFFYDQVPDCLRSLGLALYLCIFGIGRVISGFLISIIDGVTGGKEAGWFANNLNKAHIDYFSGCSPASVLVLLWYICTLQDHMFIREKWDKHTSVTTYTFFVFMHSVHEHFMLVAKQSFNCIVVLGCLSFVSAIIYRITVYFDIMFGEVIIFTLKFLSIKTHCHILINYVTYKYLFTNTSECLSAEDIISPIPNKIHTHHQLLKLNLKVQPMNRTSLSPSLDSFGIRSKQSIYE